MLTNNKVLIRGIAGMLITFSALAVAGCSNNDDKKSSNSMTGALKKTEYCTRYREFDDKVATATDTQQLELLKKITAAPDFPPELKKDYDLVISGYEDSLQGEYVLDKEDEYRDASARMNRHAIDNCELLESNDYQKSPEDK